MSEPTTDTDQQIENAIAVLENAREQLQKIESAKAADEAARKAARAEYESANALYASQARAFGLGQTTHRPVKPDASIVDSLTTDLELRQAAANSVRGEIAEFDQELEALFTQRVHAEHDTRSREFSAQLGSAEGALQDLLGFVLAHAQPQRALTLGEDDMLAAVGVAIRVDSSKVTIEIPRPKTVPHHEAVLMRSISAKRTPRLARMLADRAQARGEAASARESLVESEHASAVAVKVGQCRSRVFAAQQNVARDPGHGASIRHLVEVEREARAALTEIHRADLLKRLGKGWSGPAWSVDAVSTPAPDHSPTPTTPEPSPEQSVAPGWANADASA